MPSLNACSTGGGVWSGGTVEAPRAPATVTSFPIASPRPASSRRLRVSAESAAPSLCPITVACAVSGSSPSASFSRSISPNWETKVSEACSVDAIAGSSEPIAKILPSRLGWTSAPSSFVTGRSVFFDGSLPFS